MLYVKMITDDRFSDDHPNTNYDIITVGDQDEIVFDWLPGADDLSPNVKAIYITRKDGTVISRPLRGNVYIMNESGKTISYHGY